MIGEQIVAEARRWVNTPFEGQQSCRGAGCDCKGLIVGVIREIGLPEANSPYAKMADYQRTDSELLKRGLEETMDQVEEAQPGDLLLILLAGKPQHMAIYCGDNRMIHTMWSGPSCVRETPMCELHWKAVDSIWRWRD